MSAEISRKVHNIMAREMGQMGKFIVTKQCNNLGLDENNIRSADLPKLSKVLAEVMKTFGGDEKARRIELEIKRLGQ